MGLKGTLGTSMSFDVVLMRLALAAGVGHPQNVGSPLNGRSKTCGPLVVLVLTHSHIIGCVFMGFGGGGGCFVEAFASWLIKSEPKKQRQFCVL